MKRSRAAESLTSRIGLRKRSGQSSQAPGATKIESVQMRDLAVAAIAYGGWREQRHRAGLGEAGQEAREPGGELRGSERAAHAFRFHQCRRQEFVTAPLPGLAVGVFGEPRTRPLAQEVSQRRILRSEEHTSEL